MLKIVRSIVLAHVRYKKIVSIKSCSPEWLFRTSISRNKIAVEMIDSKKDRVLIVSYGAAPSFVCVINK